MTRKPTPSSGTTESPTGLGARASRACAALAWLLLGLAVFQPLWGQEEEEDLTAGLASMERHLKLGRDLFAALKFPEAIAEFDQVVQLYEAGKLQDMGDALPS